MTISLEVGELVLVALSPPTEEDREYRFGRVLALEYSEQGDPPVVEFKWLDNDQRRRHDHGPIRYSLYPNEDWIIPLTPENEHLAPKELHQ